MLIPALSPTTARLCALLFLLAGACSPRAAFADAPPPQPPPATPAPVATFVPDGSARFEYGKPEAKLTLAVTGLDKAVTGDPLVNVHDVPIAGTSLAVTVKELTQLKGVTTRFYELTFPVKDVPRNTQQQRTLAFTLAGKDQTLPYTLTNTVAGYSLVPKPPQSAIAINVGDWIPISAVVGPVAATGVKLLQPALIEKNTKHVLAADGVKLCKERGTVCDDGTGISPPAKGLALPANSANVLWLGPVRSVGTFDGQTVTIASDQKPDGDQTSLSVFVSSPWHKFFGVLAIMLGIAVAWLLTVYVRGRLSRDQAYLPVVTLRQTLEMLDERCAEVAKHISITLTHDRIAEQRARLKDSELPRQGLPPEIPLPWTIPGAPDVEKFRQYVQSVADWTAVLSATVPTLEYVVTKWNDWPTDPDKRAAVTTAVTGLDQLAQPGKAPALDDAQKSVNSIRAVFDTTKPVARLAAVPSGPPPAARPLTEREIRVEIAQLGTASWLVLGLITTAVGSYALIFSSAGAGFGTAVDFLTAFFWGLGLPAASQLASSATTTATVASSFKVTTGQ